MIKILKKTFSLINEKQKIRLIVLQFLSLVAALFETMGTISVAPLIAIVADNSLIQNNTYLFKAYQILGSETNSEFIIIFSLIVVAIFIIGSLSSLFINYLKLRWSTDLYLSISENLFKYFLHLPWLYHSATSSEKLISKLHTDTKRLQGAVINPFLDINSSLFILILILISIFMVNFKIALFIFTIFSTIYLLIYFSLKSHLKKAGNQLTESYPLYFKSIMESFGGIRDVILSKTFATFDRRYKKYNRSVSEKELLINFLGKIPRAIIEIFTFIIFIFIYLFLITILDYSYVKTSTILAFYALTASKMIPALQKIYLGYTSIKAHSSALDNIEIDLKKSLKKQNYYLSDSKTTNENNFKLNQKIELKKINFNYETRKKAGLIDINIQIPFNKKIGIVGKTGSGKSTLVDIIMGLVTPDSGEILVSGTKLNGSNIPDWQKLIGYVPQNIFLTDDTITNNIAFGSDEKDIDKTKINEALRLSSLEEFVDNSDIIVGERGVRLSGGQKQRIAIARALYRGSEIIFLDEATSSLDGKTESEIMNSLKLLFEKKTIIIVAHKIETIKNCDIIYLVEGGKIINSGSFLELNKKTNYFNDN